MEIVNENEESAPQQDNILEDERQRMLSNVQRAMMAPSGEGPILMPSRKASVMRASGRTGPSAPLRSSSMRAPVRPLAPTKSTDCMASMRGSSLQRANSSRIQRTCSSRGAVLRTTSSRGAPPSRRIPPDRTSSVDSTNSLRAYQRDQLSNSLLEKRDYMGRLGGPGATLERHESDMSLITAGDLSCFTMDSVNLRKTQLIADPLEDGEYNEMDSYADHESISRASQFSEYQTFNNKNHQTPVRMGPFRTPSRMGAIKVDRPKATAKENHIDDDDDDASDGSDSDDDDKSFGTMTSGLTTDFTEHDELLPSDDEDEDDDHRHEIED